jgi:formylglycine-generating enzyme required for sulfatase activity
MSWQVVAYAEQSSTKLAVIFPRSIIALHVGEWVEDCYQDSYRRVPSDGSAADFGDCSSRVLRGGAYGPEDLRAASRDKNTGTGRYSNYGFRLARSLTP